MNHGKALSGIVALSIYLGLIFLVLFFYNIHKTKAKNYVDKNDNRVTVTLVNSDKTVLNRSDKSSNENKPKPTHVLPPILLKKPDISKPKVTKSKKVEHVAKVLPKPIPKIVVPKKIVPKKRVPKKVVPKKIPKKVPKRIVPKKKVPKKVIPKKRAPKKVVPKRIPKKVPKKIVPKKKVPKKVVPKKSVPKKVVPKKIPKKVPKKVVPKKKVPKKVVPKKKVPKKSAKDLFASVKTKDVSKRPVKRTAVKKRPKTSVSKRPSSIKHNSSVADRIKRSHQSGIKSNANRDSGIKNAYIAKVKRYMNNWDAGSAHKGQRVTIALTIYNSGKFSYRIVSGKGSIRSSLSQYLDRLKRIGLGRHSKSTPYSIKVSFTVR